MSVSMVPEPDTISAIEPLSTTQNSRIRYPATFAKRPLGTRNRLTLSTLMSCMSTSPFRASAGIVQNEPSTSSLRIGSYGSSNRPL